MANKKPSVDELFEILIAACSAQFGFNPRQVSAGMRYMGPASRGVHRFRDAVTHSQILLRLVPREATLVKSSDGQEYWSEDEIDFYRKTDAVLATEAQTEKDNLTKVKQSLFFLRHAAYLRSLYRGHPEYKEENPSPLDGAISLVHQALREETAEVTALADALSIRDAETLGNLLLEPISEEHQKETQRLIRENPLFPAARAAMNEYYGLHKNAPSDTVKAAEAKLRQLVTEIQLTTKGPVFASMVTYALTCYSKDS